MSDEQLDAAWRRTIADLAAIEGESGIHAAIARAIAEWEATNGAAKEGEPNG